MNACLPHYYSSLGPFRGLFASGRPILTYHHVGPRPRGVRLKGLYVSPKLFAQQIAELKAEGFTSCGCTEIRSNEDRARQVFITFDDGFVDVFEHALPILRQHGFRAIQFFVADLLGKTSEWQKPSGELPGQLMDKAQVKEWLAAEQEIGSHTMTHPLLTQISAAQARDEILGSKKKLEDTFGRAVEHFCYPYGDWNPAVREIVQEAGYQSACTTEFGVNTLDTDRFALKRITARYPSRKLRNLGGWVRSSFGAAQS
jgi:peptidoglycan/xylan/chitin deacetylase (PgdA/CDA1 family)